MLLACIVAVAFVALATALGRALVEWIAPREDQPFYVAAAPLFGLAVLLAWVDVVNLLIPLRIGAFSVLALLAGAIWFLAKRRVRLRVDPGDALATGLALLAGAWPMFVAGRATVVAMTNDDATFYLAAADQILAYRWLDDPFGGQGPVCLSNGLLHSWMWRTGVPNLVATIVTLGRVTPTAAIAVVTMVLLALSAPSAIAIAVAIGVDARPRTRALVGAGVALSGAAVFLAWQHLLGQLFAFAFFPLAICALAWAIGKGGLRRMSLAALLLGAGMNGFADAAVALILACLSVLAFGQRRRLARFLGTGVLAMSLFAPTAYRAGWAAIGTVLVRPKEEPQGIFPQRGWLVRGVLDDLATLTGVDPWPPWPAAWPSVAAVIERVSTLAAIALVVALVLRTRNKRGVIVCAVVSIATLLPVMFGIESGYLRAKWLLLDAAMVVPLAVIAGFALARRWAQAAMATFLLGSFFAVLQMARPSGFRVIDMPDHDQLLVELARVPPGSLLVLDGFGAPADVVHDEHRAYRAANLALLDPVQPGLDGGFYKPICATTGPKVVPEVGWALSRDGAEHVSGGEVVARFGRFTLQRADLTRDFVGAWAPTHGFLRAEVEPDGTVFRWAERVAGGTLRVFTRTGCGRLGGEVRTVSSEGVYSMVSGEHPLAEGAVTPTWSSFHTAPFGVGDPVPIAFHTTASAPDPSHVLAIRKLAFVPEATCVSSIQSDGAPAQFPTTTRDVRYAIAPAAHVLCGKVAVLIEAKSPAGIEIDAGDDRAFSAVPAGSSTAKSLRLDFRRTTTIHVRVVEGDAVAITGVRVQPEPCEDHPK